MLDLNGIKALLPHREPFLLIDRIEELEPGVRAVGIKEVGHDEFWAAGHFPGNPIFPGVLVAEALAQVAGVVFLSQSDEYAGTAVYLVGMDKMRFRKPVLPGQTLRLEVTVDRKRLRIWTFETLATVDGERVAHGTFLATVAKV